MRRLRYLIGALFLLLGVTLRAGDTPPGFYFDPATLDPRLVLAPPPAANADSVEKEIEVILQKQADRTQQQLDRINSEIPYSVFVFGDVTGGWFGKDTIDGLSGASGLLGRVMATVKPIVAAAKGDWNRQRPFLINSRIYPPIERPTDSSYPSAHATRAFVDAYVLAELAPDQAQAILSRAQQVGDDRVAAGVEFPSDVEAGKKLAQAIWGRLTADEQFRQELKAAKEEVAAARKRGR
jgi:acid phosphatase (class A)